VITEHINILLADDDNDDCTFFKNATIGLPVATHLTAVHDGEQLIRYLTKNTQSLPDVIFLDLSMPRKTGFECLNEIKQNPEWKDIPVFVFSTSFSRDLDYERSLINTLSMIGADEYIRKPGDFELLKQVIHKALIKVAQHKLTKPGTANPIAGEHELKYFQMPDSSAT
jgi:CheY-like chemotaxis protein